MEKIIKKVRICRSGAFLYKVYIALIPVTGPKCYNEKKST